MFPKADEKYADRHPEYWTKAGNENTKAQAVEDLARYVGFDTRKELENVAAHRPVYTSAEVGEIRGIIANASNGFQQSAVLFGRQYGDRACYFSFATNAPDRAQKGFLGAFKRHNPKRRKDL